MLDEAPDDVSAGGRLDRTTMRTLGRRTATHPLVESWAFEPDAVDSARINIHWFVANDYYVHYIETRGTARYQCRWDRHSKTDAPRTHIHPPPDAGDAEPSPLDAHHLDVLFTVLDRVTERVETLHDDAGHSA